MTTAATERRLVAAVCTALAVAAIGVVAARVRVPFSIGHDDAGFAISNVGLAVQLAALVLGVAAVHLAGPVYARSVIVIEGAICVLAHGAVGVLYLGALAAWYVALTSPLGRLRWPCAAVLFAGFQATAWTAAREQGLVFSMLFTPRLLLFAWDRWARADEPVQPLGYAVYMLAAPLVIVPSFLLFVPFFEGFAERVRPGLSRRLAGRVCHHLAWAAGLGACRALLALRPELDGIALALARFGEILLYAAIVGHAIYALLLLHGIEERLPQRWPLAATRYVELWSRFRIHQKDMQVAMFYTPALLALRTWNRYAAIIAATLWTMAIGNLMLHGTVRYAFIYVEDPAAWWPIFARICVVNTAIGVVLAIDLCRDEWRRRHGAPRPAAWRTALGWSYTMTLAVLTTVAV